MDIDVTQNTVTLSVVSGDPKNNFHFNGNTLEVNAPIDPDFPQSDQETFELTIEATDNGVPPRSSSTRATISVTPINDHAPVIQSVVPSTSITVSTCYIPFGPCASFQ